MSEYADKHRRAGKDKAHRLANQKSDGRVDASTYGEPSQEAFDGQTSVHKPKPRAYKTGGRVEGEAAAGHAGKRPRTGNRGPLGLAPVGVRSQHPAMNLPLARKSGGRTGRDAGGEVPAQRFDFSGSAPGEMAKAAGLRTGGRAKRDSGGPVTMGVIPELMSNKPFGLKTGGKAEHPDAAQDKKLVRKMVEKDALRPSERAGRATGGRAGKGKGMNVNIVIAGHGGQQAQPGAPDPTQAPPAAHPANMPPPPPPAPPASAPPAPGAPMSPPGGAPMAPPPGLGAHPPMPQQPGGAMAGGAMPRKRGGRT